MNIFKKIIRKISHTSRHLLAWPAEIALRISNREEYDRYEKLRGQFSIQYNRIRKLNDSSLVTPFWKSFNQELEKALLPFPAWKFLRQGTISQTMVITRGGALLDIERKTLGGIFGKNMKNFVRENAMGRPLLAAPELMSSHNSIHHAYHLAQWQKSTGVAPETVSTVIEWGGGYGNFAKLFLRQSPRAAYTIIDTPLLCCLQWLYLSVVLPDTKINLISDESQKLLLNGINIIPAGLAKKINLDCELFVSTWALSESSPAAQDLVAQRNWFSAKHLLLGFQESSSDLPDASRVENLARIAGATIEDVPVLKRQHYAFR